MNSYNELTNEILERIREEVLKIQYITGETSITIFLSMDLFFHIQANLDFLLLYKCPDCESIKLFGCNVERYIDRGFSFYVTTANKIKY